jgi:copper chaperone CopZ
MYSTFQISEAECASCTNKTLKNLGTLQGVFGAEIDRIGGKIEVSHTDEISREEIAEALNKEGYQLIENGKETPVDYDEPSIWGCVL